MDLAAAADRLTLPAAADLGAADLAAAADLADLVDLAAADLGAAADLATADLAAADLVDLEAAPAAADLVDFVGLAAAPADVAFAGRAGPGAAAPPSASAIRAAASRRRSSGDCDREGEPSLPVIPSSAIALSSCRQTAPRRRAPPLYATAVGRSAVLSSHPLLP
ncbi:MAG: hypothetical protein AB1673_03905 [Actinomycetota bacterium]